MRSRPPKKQVLIVALENYKKIALKHFIEKPISSNFVNLLLDQEPLEFTFSLNFIIIRVTKLLQRPKFDIFQIAIFCNLTSITGFVIKAVRIAAGQYIWKVFFQQKTDHLCTFCTISKK